MLANKRAVRSASCAHPGIPSDYCIRVLHRSSDLCLDQQTGRRIHLSDCQGHLVASLALAQAYIYIYPDEAEPGSAPRSVSPLARNPFVSSSRKTHDRLLIRWLHHTTAYDSIYQFALLGIFASMGVPSSRVLLFLPELDPQASSTGRPGEEGTSRSIETPIRLAPLTVVLTLGDFSFYR